MFIGPRASIFLALGLHEGNRIICRIFLMLSTIPMNYANKCNLAIY